MQAKIAQPKRDHRFNLFVCVHSRTVLDLAGPPHSLNAQDWGTPQDGVGVKRMQKVAVSNIESATNNDLRCHGHLELGRAQVHVCFWGIRRKRYKLHESDHYPITWGLAVSLGIVELQRPASMYI